MKKMNPFLQFLIGFFGIGFLWLAGVISFETDNLFLRHFIPLIVVILITSGAMISAVIAKKHSMKFMYISALVASGVPLVSSILGSIICDIRNGLEWLYGLTIGLLLHPFELLSRSVFDSASSFFDVFLYGYVESDGLQMLATIIIIASLIVYKVTKPVKNCPK